MSLSNGHAPTSLYEAAPPADLGERSPAPPQSETYATLADGTTLSQAEWLEERNKDHGIGASDLPKIVLGHAVKLWYQKKGLVPDDAGDCEQARWGRILEPHILDRFAAETGEVIVSKQLMLRHPDHPWLFVTLDALCLSGLTVEAKFLTSFGNDDEDGFGWKPDSPPLKWQIQAQQSMAITGEDQVAFAVFYGPEGAYKQIFIQRDDALWAQLFTQAQAFRQSLIDNTPPTEFHPDDAAMISKLHRGKSDGPALELDDPKLLAAVQSYLAHADLTEREKSKDKAKAAIFQALGTSTTAKIAGYTLTRKVTAKQTRLEVTPPPEA